MTTFSPKLPLVVEYFDSVIPFVILFRSSKSLIPIAKSDLIKFFIYIEYPSSKISSITKDI